MDKENDYRPIDCALYSEYETAIMHRECLRVHWRDSAGGDHLEALRPTDLQTRSGEEFMYATTENGEQRCIRLDRIVHTESIKGEQP